MDLILKRKWLSKNSTIGELYVDGKFECFTLEDYLPDPYVKVAGKTCIPNGRYEVVITHSQRFGVDMPLLVAVPGFEGIRIHPGNTAADTEGCLLVGRIAKVDKVEESRLAYAELFKKLKETSTKIHILIEVDK